MKFKFIYIFLFISTFLFAQEQKLNEAEILSFKKNVEKEAKNTQTLKTDFVQYKHMDFLSKDIESSGKMAFKSPNTLLWHYLKPYDYSVIFKSGKIFINDQGKKSTIDAKSKMFEKMNKLIVGSVSGNMFDDKEFTISYFKTKDYFIAKFIPKASALKKYIKQVDLYFSNQNYSVSQVKMIEPSNDYTKIIFKNKVENVKIDESVFTN